jgi:hypothetical protein
MSKETNDNLPAAQVGINDLEKLKSNIEIWKTVISVQQHFNTIEMQIRNFAVSILAGILAAAGLALRDPKNITIFNSTVSSASAILIGGIIVLLSFYFMDRFWYHRLLQGAVSRGEDLETEIKKVLPQVALSQTIRANSPVGGIRSDRKIDIFYGIIIFFMLITAIGANFFQIGNSDEITSDDVIYNGSFNMTLKNNQIDTASNNLRGNVLLEIRINKTNSDLETILKNVDI